MFSTALAEQEEAALRFLVADHRQFQRRLVTDTLRTLGRSEILYAGTSEECISLVSVCPPDILFVDWDFEKGTGLELVKRLRAGDAGENGLKSPIVILAQRRQQRDVDAARLAGVDEFIVRPFSITTVKARIKSIQRKQAYAEGRTDKDDAPDVQIRKGLVRMYVERLNGMLDHIAPGAEAREFKLACAQLSVLANDLKEPLLISATFSLSNYVRAVVGEARMNRSVIDAHLQAVLQLAELPNSQYELRRTVTDELNKLVAKKLGRGG